MISEFRVTVGGIVWENLHSIQSPIVAVISLSSYLTVDIKNLYGAQKNGHSLLR